MTHPLRYAALLLVLILATVGAVAAQDASPEPASPSDSQSTLVIITPSPNPPATPPPAVNRSPSSELNPKPADLPVIDTSFSIDTTRKDGYVITDFAPIYLREGAGVQYRPMATVRGGVALDVTGVNERETWWRVRTANNAFEGWINAELLILRGDLTDVPTISPEDMGARLPITFVTFAPQSLYSAPTDSADALLCTIQPDEDALLAQDRTGEFYQINATCQNGAARTGWIEASAGALRNPTGGAVPVVGTLFLPDDPNLNTVNGPALLVFQRQTVYLAPRVRPSTVACDIMPNRYPVLARDVPTDYYLIRATCVDSTTVDAWISAEAGAFQNNTEQGVPIAVTPTDTAAPTPLAVDAPRLLTFLPQSVLASPDGAEVCRAPAGEYRILAAAPGDEAYQVTATCTDGTSVTGWMAADAGAFRNPGGVTVPVVEGS